MAFNKTIFPITTLSREDIKWEDFLYELTPVEYHADATTKKACFFKREDYFAPMGYGGINGSKLRQAIYLASKNMKIRTEYLIGAMSLHSPQLPMQAAVGKHFGKKVITICPGTDLNKVLEHDMPALAAWFGSEFWLCTIGYNGVLQKRAQELQKYLGGESYAFYLEYAITLGLEHSAEEIFNFHCVGAEQVKNIPDDTEELIMAAGSCNSSTSVLLGLAKYRKPNLKRIHFITTGPSKIEYLTKRLEKMNEVSGFETRVFKGLPYADDLFFPVPDKFPYEVIVHDQQREGFSVYSDLLPFTFDNIELHPTYEGKIMTYIMKTCPELIHKKSLFWIVGSYPTREAMEPYYQGKNISKAKLFSWER